MGRKPGFKPKVRRIKLNPEQAVLSCKCYDGGKTWDYIGPGHQGLTFTGGALCSCYTAAKYRATLSGSGEYVLLSGEGTIS